MSLAAALLSLAKDGCSQRDRNSAAEIVSDYVLHRGRARLRRKFEDTSAALFDDAAQHCLERASCGAAHFSGTTDAGARSWCNQVMKNYVLDVLRRKENELTVANAERDDDGNYVEKEHMDRKGDLADAHLLGTELQSQLQFLMTSLKNQNEGRVPDNVLVWFEHRLGQASTEAQVAKWELDGQPAVDHESLEWIRARDRVFQNRRRGRQAACRAVEGLIRQGLGEYSHELRLMLGCKGSEGTLSGKKR